MKSLALDCSSDLAVIGGTGQLNTWATKQISNIIWGTVEVERTVAILRNMGPDIGTS